MASRRTLSTVACCSTAKRTETTPTAGDVVVVVVVAEESTWATVRAVVEGGAPWTGSVASGVVLVEV